jgi:hypothetical protein
LEGEAEGAPVMAGLRRCGRQRVPFGKLRAGSLRCALRNDSGGARFGMTKSLGVQKEY